MFKTSSRPTTCILEFEWEDDEFVIEATATTGKSEHTIISVGKHGTSKGRVIAGHKRAMNAQVNALRVGGGGRDVVVHQDGGRDHVMQSITTMPGLGHLSFEELRLECYLQSMVAKDAPPAPVDALATPWAVIQPVFKEFKGGKEQDVYMRDSDMADDREMMLGDIEPLNFWFKR